jgi:ferritin
VNFESTLKVFEMALAHEKKISAHINQLYKLAKDENDYAFESFLKWFLDEQVEEEATAGEIIDRLKMAGDNSAAILMLDKELGARN